MDVKKVLILTSDYGNGHLKVADSLYKQIKQIDNNIDVKIVNPFNEGHPLLNKVIRYIYIKSYSAMPRLYNIFYYMSKQAKYNCINKINILYCNRIIKHYLEEFNPDIVINTFSVLSVPMYYKSGVTKVPCYTIITDYGIHSQWIHDGTCKYFVAHKCLKEELKSMGIEDSKIEDMGIPVYMDCPQGDNKELIKRNKIINNDLDIITILCGANSVLRNLRRILNSILLSNDSVHLVVVCGKNNKVKEKIEDAFHNYKDRVTILGFVDNIYEIFKLSKLVITKPGGITITELINLNIPFVLYGVPPGQERENVKFLLKHGCAVHAQNHRELAKKIKYLLNNEKKLKLLKLNLGQIFRPNACEEIAKSILNIKDVSKKE